VSYKYYWEDFPVGQTVELGGYEMKRDEIIAFARQFDPQPFHVDEEAAKASFFGGLIASGWHTCSIAMRLMCDAYLSESASLGSPGVENIRWLKPVRPGDTLRVTRTCVESRPSSKNPDLGIVKSRWDAYNQHDETVMTMEGISMFRRRQPGI
jgi:acyl dehydratase